MQQGRHLDTAWVFGSLCTATPQHFSAQEATPTSTANHCTNSNPIGLDLSGNLSLNFPFQEFWLGSRRCLLETWCANSLFRQTPRGVHRELVCTEWTKAVVSRHRRPNILDKKKKGGLMCWCILDLYFQGGPMSSRCPFLTWTHGTAILFLVSQTTVPLSLPMLNANKQSLLLGYLTVPGDHVPSFCFRCLGEPPV